MVPPHPITPSHYYLTPSLPHGTHSLTVPSHHIMITPSQYILLHHSLITTSHRITTSHYHSFHCSITSPPHRITTSHYHSFHCSITLPPHHTLHHITKCLTPSVPHISTSTPLLHITTHSTSFHHHSLTHNTTLHHHYLTLPDLTIHSLTVPHLTPSLPHSCSTPFGAQHYQEVLSPSQ